MQVIGLCATATSALVIGTNAWVRAQASPLAFVSASAIPPRTVAVVPGAVVSHGQPGGSLKARLETALELYRVRRVKTILVSGNDSAASPEVTVMRAWLSAHGVPASDVLSDPRGTRTRETMLNAAGQFDISSAIICTQAAYVDRALFLARHAGIDAIGVGLPSSVSRSARGLGLEAIKTTVAFVESFLRPGPTHARAPETQSVLAAR